MQGPQIVKGFYLRPELLRIPLPSGDYLLALTFYFNKKPQVEFKIYFVYTEDLKKD